MIADDFLGYLLRPSGYEAVQIADSSTPTEPTDEQLKAFALRATGTVTAPRTMQLPHLVGVLRLVENATAAVLTAKGKTGTGVDIDPGGSALVYSTGAVFKSASGASAPADASPTVKGIVKLAGDLGGTADAPTVAKVNGHALTTSADVLRGDGSAGPVPAAALPGPAASTRGGVALPASATGLYFRDDGTFAAVSAGGWRTAYEVDFTAHGTVSIPNTGSVTIDGKVWTAVGCTAAGVTLTSAGLVGAPSVGGATFGGIKIALSGLVASLGRRVRVVARIAYTATGGLPGSGANESILHVSPNGLATVFADNNRIVAGFRGDTSLVKSVMSIGYGSGTLDYNAATYIACDVFSVELDTELFLSMTGTYSAGWPSGGNMPRLTSGRSLPLTNMAQDCGIALAFYNGSDKAFTSTVSRLAIQSLD